MTSDLSTAARHSFESSEHYTPPFIVEPARVTLGAFDLDPASCVEANRWIRAEGIFLCEDDGFTQSWWGRVFLNPPGGLSDNQQRLVKGKCRETGSCGLPIGHTHEGVEASQKKWWFKLAREYRAGNVEAAIFVCFSVELLQNTQVDTPVGLPIPLDFPICYPSRRVPYVKPGGAVGSQPPHASCIVLVAGRETEYAERFASSFAPIGRVVR
jgi:hypothetical protein